jgi:hypothetical protein
VREQLVFGYHAKIQKAKRRRKKYSGNLVVVLLEVWSSVVDGLSGCRLLTLVGP